MNEYFQFAIGLRTDGAHFLEGQFARKNNPSHAKLLRQTHAFHARDAHLRASMQRKFRGEPPRQSGCAQVLNDDGVRSCRGDCRKCSCGFGQLFVEHQRIESDESLHAAGVQGTHDFRQFIDFKAYFRPGREMF